jgi:hypothetical protein
MVAANGGGIAPGRALPTPGDATPRLSGADGQAAGARRTSGREEARLNRYRLALWATSAAVALA